MSERPPISPRSPRAALEPEQVPPPPKRSERARNPFVVVGNAIITIILISDDRRRRRSTVYGKQMLESPGPLQEDKIVNIPRAPASGDIADTLQREGVINVNPWLFIGSVFALKASSELKPGEYSFQKNASLRDVIGTIVEGKVVQHAVTIPEGLTSEQIVARLTDNDIFAGSVREMPREGTLLPETYKFPRGTTREQVIQRMQQTQKRVLAEIWERRNPDIPVKSPEQLVTLASIVEKETGKADERSRVAAVFANRLRQKIKLQSDPTIIYGLVGGKGTLGRPIKRSEIQQPSPYNTYVIEGLPPGPIANPGRASLEAAANPARTRDLFFVADGTGGHTFTETYDQHQKNVAKLRAMEKQIQNDTVEPAEDAPAAAAGRRAGRYQSDRDHDEAGGAEEAAARGLRRPGAGPAGRRAIDHDAAGGSALTPAVTSPDSRNAIPLWREIVLRSRRSFRVSQSLSFGEFYAMALSSMTGFARSHGASGPYTFEWELKSVNAKGFDLRMRLPPGWDELEALAKKRAGEVLSRGTVYANLNVKRANAVSTIRINEDVLASIVKVAGDARRQDRRGGAEHRWAARHQGRHRGRRARKRRGGGQGGEGRRRRGLRAGADHLVEMRRREGATLGQILIQRMDEIEKLAKKAEAAPGRKPEAIKARLAEQIAALLETSERFDPDRLNQEAILIAAKADIREELDRIASHIAQAREMIGKGGPVGRRLDFLAQEFNREVNTCCSKSNDLELTNTGLEMKNVVEQFREQVQNLE